MCAALGQEIRMVLADDRCRAHIKHHWLVIACGSY
jgi:hypothetical protein